MKDEHVARAYMERTGQNLTETDRIDYDVLSELFIGRFSHTPYEAVASKASDIIGQNKSRFSCWLDL